MTPYEFIDKWRASALKERSAAQEHFIDLCRLLGEAYCFERGARKDTGGDGWADVWKRHHARRVPARFTDLAGALFQGMARGGLVGFETVDWFNGGLFDDDTALPLEKSDIDAVLAASNLDWSEIDPSILGTLFERGLDPDKRAQLGAHYTDRDKIMLLVEPVVIGPWLAEWKAEKTNGRSPRSARPTSRASRSTPTRPSWPASRSGSARSSGCAVTASRRPATRSSSPWTPSSAAMPS